MEATAKLFLKATAGLPATVTAQMAQASAQQGGLTNGTTTSIDAFMHDLLVSTGSLTGPSTSKPPLAPAQHAAAPGLTMDAIFQEIMANRMANKAPLANASPLRNDSSFSTALLLSQGSMLSHQPSFLGGLSHQGSFFGLNHQGSLDKLMRATSIDKVLAELHVPSLHGGQSDKEWASAYNNLAGAMQASGGALKQAGEMPNQLSAILEQEHSHDDMDGDGKRKSDDGAIGSGSGQSRPPRPPVHRRSSINSLTAEDISLNLDALGGLHDFPRSSHSVGRPSREQELQHDVALLVGQNHALMQRLQQLAHQAEAAARENTSLKQLLTCLEPSPALLGSHPSLAALLTLKRANSSMPTRHSSGVSGGMSGGNASNASASGLYDEPSSGSGLGLVSTKRKRSAVSGQRGRPKASTVAPVFGRGSAVATAASGMVSAARNLPGGVANGYSGAVPASLGPPAGSMSSLSDLEAARVAAAALAANKGDACAALTQLLGLVGNRR
ncbi:hypothetical protein WJX72_002115 [[Myrmecia] bisecta]|uniref:Uncharacterized protein n=1 Tax=[Myrmecia] bisecta TaxID=41462 RepID=A0AAW1QPC7_9CHLO